MNGAKGPSLETLDLSFLESAVHQAFSFRFVFQHCLRKTRLWKIKRVVSMVVYVTVVYILTIERSYWNMELRWCIKGYIKDNYLPFTLVVSKYELTKPCMKLYSFATGPGWVSKGIYIFPTTYFNFNFHLHARSK